MAFYDEMAALADELIAEFGAAASITRTTPGGYDPATGTTTGDTTQTWTGRGVKFDYKVSEVDGTNIRRGDQRVYLSAIGMPSPLTGDKLTIDGTQFAVVESRPLRPAMTTVLLDIQVRGVA